MFLCVWQKLLTIPKIYIWCGRSLRKRRRISLSVLYIVMYSVNNKFVGAIYRKILTHTHTHIFRRHKCKLWWLLEHKILYARTKKKNMRELKEKWVVWWFHMWVLRKENSEKFLICVWHLDIRCGRTLNTQMNLV